MARCLERNAHAEERRNDMDVELVDLAGLEASIPGDGN
jgi:hypothetical protein